jgi:beta-lactam-binding protein with PASTA domain
LQLSRGSSVTVYTTDGSQTTIPEVTGKQIGDAQDALADAGFTNVSVSKDYPNGNGDNECLVAAVDPGQGTAVSKDTGITLSVYGNKNGKSPKGCR